MTHPSTLPAASLVRAHGILDQLNLDPSHLERREEVDIKQYREAVVSEKPVSSAKLTKVVDQINVMESEGFIPSKVAVFLKNNLHDATFTTSLLIKLVGDLQERGVITPKIREYLFERIGSGYLSQVIQFLYACMIDPNKGSSIAQDVLVEYSDGEISKFIERNEQIRSRDYLKSKVLTIGKKLTVEESEEYIRPLIRAIDEDNPKVCKEKFVALLDFVSKNYGGEIEKFCFEDACEAFKGIPVQGFFVAAHHAFLAQDFYGAYVAQVRDLTRELESMPMAEQDAHELTHLFEKCRLAYENTMCVLADFKNMPCISKTAFSLAYGQLSTEWMKVNRLFNQKKHLLCHCHASGHPMPVWPLYNQDRLFAQVSPTDSVADTGQSVAVLGCEWGNGHRSATQNVAKAFERMGYHPYAVNLPEDVLGDEDSVRSVLGRFNSKCNVGWLFNNLLQRRAFRIINLLRGNPKPQEPGRATIKKVVQQMLRINPKMIVSTYSAHNESVIAAAKIMGLPVMHVCTDVDVTVSTRDKPPAYDHFKMAIPYPEPKQMANAIGNSVREDQLVVSGPPVKEIDDQDRTLEDVLRMKDKWNIPRDKKVVLITNGGNGGNSPYVDMLVKMYAGKRPEEIPFHLVVLCGKNNADFRDHIVRDVIPKTNIKIDPYTFVPPESMEELITMAGYGGCVIGKAGGMTMFELMKRGTRVLVDEMPVKLFSGGVGTFFINLFNSFLALFKIKNKFPWEDVNQEFARGQGLSQVIHSQKDFVPAFEKALSHDEPVRMTVEAPKFNQVLPRISREMMEKAQRDVELQRRLTESMDARQLLT